MNKIKQDVIDEVLEIAYSAIANDLINHGEEIAHTLTYQSYQHNRDAGMPYRPTDQSIWGKDNEQLEARYQYDLEREQDDV